MATFKLTASSQLKSANTENDISHHSGKKNRQTHAHKNKDIDLTRSHLNVEFDVLSRKELLDAHYGQRVANRKKNNNSKGSWDSVETYLASFEGKTVGKSKKNVRWATVSQLTYVGDKDAMKGILETFKSAGVSEEEFQEAYSRGYRTYIDKHNEKFPTLPIYHSDIHFDEATPHGHDAIVVMGHTAKGLASDSLDKALGEKYGYKEGAANKENVQAYREENDALAFESITAALSSLADEKGVVIDFEFTRKGQSTSVNSETYKRGKDLDAKELELNALELTLKTKAKGLKEREDKIIAKEDSNVLWSERLSEREQKVKADDLDLVSRENILKKRKEDEEKRLSREWWNGFKDGVNTSREMVSSTGLMPTDKAFLKEVTSDVAVEFRNVKGKDGGVVQPHTRMRVAKERAAKKSKLPPVLPAKPTTSLEVER